jgi:ABC-2 type transport system permease protein
VFGEIEMINTNRSPFFTVIQAEILYNLKRIAPYAMLILFCGNAMLWRKGPSVRMGWATNSDQYIIGQFVVFSFLTLPFFIALIMSDPIIRDFRIGIDPLLFSKPISRGEYLFGKFTGNFFVLVCCQSAYAITHFLLQYWHTPEIIIQPARLFPYLHYFFFFTVISSLMLATLCFTVATLSRNPKLAYGLIAAFYVLYISFQIMLKNLPRWRMLLDPLLITWLDVTRNVYSADQLNQLTFHYTLDLLLNRTIIIAISVGSLIFLYYRFNSAPLAIFQPNEQGKSISLFNLSTASIEPQQIFEPVAQTDNAAKTAFESKIAIPRFEPITEGFNSYYQQLIAAIGTELRLLWAEKSTLLFFSITIISCLLVMLIYNLRPVPSYGVAYAVYIANGLLLFFIAMAIFFSGELIDRDRELNIRAILWSLPISNSILLLSKFFAILLLELFLSISVSVVAIIVQLFKGHTPLEIKPLLLINGLILLPSIVFLIAISLILNLLLRDKYLAYIVILAIGIGLYYLYSQGYMHWLYNPILYQLWSYTDLVEPGNKLTRILLHRSYLIAITVGLLASAQLIFERKMTKRLWIDGCLTANGRAVIIIAMATTFAVITGVLIY